MNGVLIPAYEPDEKLIELVSSLKSEGFAVIVVNDGSSDKYDCIFNSLHSDTHIITLPHNCGKGAALKAGFRYINEQLPYIDGVITCDADGQHKVEDVIRVSNALESGEKFVLTMRKPRKGIPLRSKVGNTMSRVVYALLTNRYLSDNQSGLRGFAREHINWLLAVEKDKYDYEMNVLYYAAKKSIRIHTIYIEAIYIDDNESSHFSPVKDTVRIYKSLFRLAMGSFISLLVSELLIIAVSVIFGYRHFFITLPGVAAIGYALNIILTRSIFMKKTVCYDYWTMLIFHIINYIFYTLMCIILGLVMPLWLSFNIAYLIGLPLRYYLHKFLFVALKTHE